MHCSDSRLWNVLRIDREKPIFLHAGKTRPRIALALRRAHHLYVDILFSCPLESIPFLIRK